MSHRLASAPISWGVCEVPGWGKELPANRVLAEMQSLGLVATELGSVGYLPTDPGELQELLASFDLSLLGGFVPLVLHDPDEVETVVATAIDAAQLMSAAGATMFVTAVVPSWDWGPRPPMESEQWRHIAKMLETVGDIAAGHNMVQALHPHLDTLVETNDDVARMLDLSDTGWTLDTGHLLIGGTDPMKFIEHAFDRIVHVHLKDVRVELAQPVLRDEQTIMEAVQAGMFTNLGEGDIAIAEIVEALEARGYSGWYVLEQDTAMTGDAPPPGEGPVGDVGASLDYLRAALPDGAPTLAPVHPLR